MKDQKLLSNINQEDFLKGIGLAPLLPAQHEIYVSSVKNKQLEDLPDEAILNVLYFLDLPDLIRCGLVSKRFRSMSFIESLWQKIDISSHVCYRKIDGKIKPPTTTIVSMDLVKIIMNRGCKSLSLRGNIKFKGDLYHSDLSRFKRLEKKKSMD